MSAGFTVTAGPTMANPDAFHTVEDLRRELTRANDEMFKQSLRISDLTHTLNIQVNQNEIMCKSVKAMGNELVDLVMLYRRGEVSGLLHRLADLEPRLHTWVEQNAGHPAAPDVSLGGLH